MKEEIWPMMSLSASGRRGEAMKAMTISSRVYGSSSSIGAGSGVKAWEIAPAGLITGALAVWLPLPEAPVSAVSSASLHARRFCPEVDGAGAVWIGTSVRMQGRVMGGHLLLHRV